jgi:hypothetical protein
MDRQVECSWLWSWRRNEVVVDLMAHLNEEADDIARPLSWMCKGGERRRPSRGLKLADYTDNSLLSVLSCITEGQPSLHRHSPPQSATVGTCMLATHRGLLSDL